jgi:hypothetical protein
MKDLPLFSFDRFLALAGSELVNYVEPYVNTHAYAIPEAVYDPLQSGLATFDVEHTVYALEICMLLKPREFVSCAVGFLSHSDSSVCCTAYRVLSSLPREMISIDLARKIAATPRVDLFDPHWSGKRIRIGTNEEFIRGLAAKLG